MMMIKIQKAVFLFFFFATLTILPQIGRAAEEKPISTATTEEIENLVDNLKDDAKREELIHQLETLVSAQKEVASETEIPSLSAQTKEIMASWRQKIENIGQNIDDLLALAQSLLFSLLIIFAGFFIFRRGQRVLQKMAKGEKQIGLPGLERRIQRYVSITDTAFRALMILVTILALASLWGGDVMAWLNSDWGQELLSAAMTIIIIVALCTFFWELSNYVIEKRLGKESTSTRMRTILPLARNALLITLVTMAGLVILSELGVNIAPLLAGAGVIGLAIGFGAQTLVKDFITGAFILVEDTIHVGDVVKLGDLAGLVEKMTIRTVQLRDLSGTVHIIPFSEVTTVSNLTKDFSCYVFDIGVSYDTNIDHAIEVLQKVDEEMREDKEIAPEILEPLEIFGLDQLGDSALVIKGRIKTRPIKQWLVGRAYNKKIKEKFDEAGIEIPFPHQTVYHRHDYDWEKKMGIAEPVKFGD